MAKNKEKPPKSKRKIVNKPEEVSPEMEKLDEGKPSPEVESESEVRLPSKKSKKEKQLNEGLMDCEVKKNKKQEKNDVFDNEGDDEMVEKRKKPKPRNKKKNKNKLLKEKSSEEEVITLNLGDFMNANVTKVSGEPQLNIISIRTNNESEESETIISLRFNEWQLMKQLIPQIDELMNNSIIDE